MEEGVHLDLQLLRENPYHVGSMAAGGWSQELRDCIFKNTESRESKLEVWLCCKFLKPAPVTCFFQKGSTS